MSHQEGVEIPGLEFLKQGPSALCVRGVHKKSEETCASSLPVYLKLFSRDSRLAGKRLSGDDARGDKEEQIMRSDVDTLLAEQVPDHRQAAEDRHLVHVGLLLGNDDAADDHRAAVGNRHLGLRRL